VSRNRENPVSARLTDLDRADQRRFAEADDKQFVTALARGLDVLRAFSEGRALLGNQEIAQLTRLPKSTVSRLTYTLSRLGFLDYEAKLGKYRPGLAGLALGHNALRALALRRVALPWMREMSQRGNCAVSLLARDRLELVVVEECVAEVETTSMRDVGARLPITAHGPGRALLVGMPQAERLYVLEHLQHARPDEWMDLERSIYGALAEYQRLGFTVSDGDHAYRGVSVGTPCIPADGGRVMALSCTAPPFRVSRERLIGEIGPRLVEAVERIRLALETGG
jgi:DNA-binding IclR family transcriptional regulator